MININDYLISREQILYIKKGDNNTIKIVLKSLSIPITIEFRTLEERNTEFERVVMNEKLSKNS